MVLMFPLDLCERGNLFYYEMKIESLFDNPNELKRELLINTLSQEFPAEELAELLCKLNVNFYLDNTFRRKKDHNKVYIGFKNGAFEFRFEDYLTQKIIASKNNYHKANTYYKSDYYLIRKNEIRTIS